MARKSPWQQFADNFEATNSTFNKFFTAKETAEIMKEQPQELQSGIGPGPQSQYQASYGGKTYDKQITPEMLKGLRTQRISDVMAKYGDSEGAMKRQLDSALLQKYQDESALAQGTLQGQIDNLDLTNQGISANTAMTQAQMQIMVDKAPIEQRAMIAQAYGYELTNAGKVIDNRIKSKTEDATVGLKNNELESSNMNLEIQKDNRDNAKGINRNLKKQSDIETETAERENNIAKSKYGFDLTSALMQSQAGMNQAEASVLATQQILDGNQTLMDFSTMMGNGEFESVQDQKDWLMTNWNGDQRVLAMIDTIDAADLSQITVEGTKTMAQIDAAFTGKSQNAAKDELIKIIDMQDGITGNMRWDTKDGKVQLLETDGDGQINTIAEGANWNDFKEKFYAEFTPLKSLEIAKTNADTKLVLAQAKKYNADALIPPRDYAKEKWQSMVTQFLTSDTYFQATSEDPDGSQGLAAKALEAFKAQYNTDPEILPKGVTVTQN